MTPNHPPYPFFPKSKCVPPRGGTRFPPKSGGGRRPPPLPLEKTLSFFPINLERQKRGFRFLNVAKFCGIFCFRFFFLIFSQKNNSPLKELCRSIDEVCWPIVSSVLLGVFLTPFFSLFDTHSRWVSCIGKVREAYCNCFCSILGGEAVPASADVR